MATTVVVQVPGEQRLIDSSENASPQQTRSSAGLVCGILHLMAAAVEIITTSVALYLGTDYRLGWGIWAGILLYGVAGILGVLSGFAKTNNHGVIIGYLVMSILSSLSAPCHMIYESVASSHDGKFCRDFIYLLLEDDYLCPPNIALETLHGISAVVSVFEMVVAIVSASICCCCGGLCCPENRSYTTTHEIITQYPQQGQVTTGNQFGTYPQAPLINNPNYRYPVQQPQQYPQRQEMMNPPAYINFTQQQLHQQANPPVYETLK